MRRMPELLPDWDDVLSAASRLQKILPDAVLVGGTAVALHANHRRSYDADHFVSDLRSHFDDVLQTLEHVAGWTTARVNKPVQILGSLDGIDTGIRQLIRTAPLKTRSIETQQGLITVPTKLETLRIKAALILKRNATRDYVDFIALADKLGKRRSAVAMLDFDMLYPQPNGQSPTQQLIAQLADPKPYDREDTDLSTYRGLAPRYADWASSPISDPMSPSCSWTLCWSVATAIRGRQALKVPHRLPLRHWVTKNLAVSIRAGLPDRGRSLISGIHEFRRDPPRP